MNHFGHPQKRMCNRFGCDGRMRPTEELVPLATPGPDQLRIFECTRCENRQPWLDDPAMDGSFAELHKIKNHEGWHGVSMMSDPYCYPPKPPTSRRTR